MKFVQEMICTYLQTQSCESWMKESLVPQTADLTLSALGEP